MGSLDDIKDLAVIGAIGVGAYLLYTYAIAPLEKKPKPPSVSYPPTTYIPQNPQALGAPPGTPGTVFGTGLTPEQVLLTPAYDYVVAPLGVAGDVSRQAADVIHSSLSALPLVGNPLANEFNAFYGAGYKTGQEFFQAGKSAGDQLGAWLKSIGF